MTDDPFDGDHGPLCTCDADLAERWHEERELDAADAADRDWDELWDMRREAKEW